MQTLSSWPVSADLVRVSSAYDFDHIRWFSNTYTRPRGWFGSYD